MKRRLLTLITVVATTFSFLSPLSVSAAAFTDVPSSKYYAAPVAWAVEEGITSGTTDTTFSPGKKCTRGQIVTFLYKANGGIPVSTSSSFSDVKPQAYYYDAVNWAVANGVTSGKGNGKFAPNDECSRAEAVTFMWKLAGSPPASTGTTFTDVSSKAYYAQAVNWAVSKGITKGTSETTFRPGKKCTRAEIITFLYKEAGSPSVTVPETNKTYTDAEIGSMALKAVREVCDADYATSYSTQREGDTVLVYILGTSGELEWGASVNRTTLKGEIADPQGMQKQSVDFSKYAR